MRKARLADRIALGGPVFMAAALQYLTCEVLEMAGEISESRKKKTIAPKHLQVAIRGDEELNKLLCNIQISSGGTVPNIQAALFPKNKPNQPFCHGYSAILN